MKKNKIGIGAGVLLLLCIVGCGVQGKEGFLPSPAPSSTPNATRWQDETPSPLPAPSVVPGATVARDETPSPLPGPAHTPELSNDEIEKLTRCLDIRISDEIRMYGCTPSKNIQRTLVDVFYGGNQRYDMYLKLDDDYYWVRASWEYLNGPVVYQEMENCEDYREDYRQDNIAAFAEKFDYEYMGRFEYDYNPEIEHNFPNEYFDRWPEVRDAIIEKEVRERRFPGKYIYVFCKYTEERAYEPGDAKVYFFVLREGAVSDYVYLLVSDVYADRVTIGWPPSSVSGKLDYYREREFDRVKVTVPEKQ